MKSNEINSKHLYKSSLTVYPCVLYTALVFGVFGPIFFFGVCGQLNISLSIYYISTSTVSLFLWVIFLRKNYFFENHMLVVYPLRIVRRRIRINYEDVACFIYNTESLGGVYLDMISKEGSRINIFIRKWVYSPLFSVRIKRKRFQLFFLLKHLKSKGVRIKSDRCNDDTEKRIEMIFGAGASHYIRKSPAEKKKAHKKKIRDTIIANIIVLVVLVLALFYFSHFVYNIF